jgi:hypothetical protein
MEFFEKKIKMPNYIYIYKVELKNINIDNKYFITILWPASICGMALWWYIYHGLVLLV